MCPSSENDKQNAQLCDFTTICIQASLVKYTGRFGCLRLSFKEILVANGNLSLHSWGRGGPESLCLCHHVKTFIFLTAGPWRVRGGDIGASMMGLLSSLVQLEK